MKFDNIAFPVKLAGAISESSKIRFRTLNRKTRLPVKAEYRDEQTDEPVPREEQVKGYELDKNDFLIIEPEEIAKLKTAGEQRLDIDGFVDAGEVSSVYRDKPYFLYPSDRIATEPYSLIRDAMTKANAAAIGRIVMQQRERSVLVESRHGGMVMTLLRKANAVVDEAQFFSGINKQKIDPELLDVATMLIDRKRTHFDPSRFEDRYENALIDMIEAKIKGNRPATKALPRPRENVVNLAALFRKSLEREKLVAKAKSRKAA